jgi:hypothetical protein
VRSLGSVFFVRLFRVFRRHRGKGSSVQGVRGAKAGAEMEMLHVRLQYCIAASAISARRRVLYASVASVHSFAEISRLVLVGLD